MRSIFIFRGVVSLEVTIDLPIGKTNTAYNFMTQNAERFNISKRIYCYFILDTRFMTKNVVNRETVDETGHV